MANTASKASIFALILFVVLALTTAYLCAKIDPTLTPICLAGVGGMFGGWLWILNSAADHQTLTVKADLIKPVTNSQLVYSIIKMVTSIFAGIVALSVYSWRLDTPGHLLTFIIGALAGFSPNFIKVVSDKFTKNVKT